MIAEFTPLFAYVGLESRLRVIAKAVTVGRACLGFQVVKRSTCKLEQRTLLHSILYCTMLNGAVLQYSHL